MAVGEVRPAYGTAAGDPARYKAAREARFGHTQDMTRPLKAAESEGVEDVLHVQTFLQGGVVHVARAHLHDVDAAHGAHVPVMKGTDARPHLLRESPGLAAVAEQVNDNSLVGAPLCSQLYSGLRE